MSGRKQHYIPQFLLRSFGEKTLGKKIQVQVTTRDKNFVVPTDGIAAQREFYSSLDSDAETLDDIITSAEHEYALIFKELCESTAGEFSDSTNVARLATHLAVRGNYLRQAMATFGRYATTRLTTTMSDPEKFKLLLGIGRAEPTPVMRDKFDKMYNEKRDLMRKSKISRHEFRKIAYDLLNAKWREFFDEQVNDIRNAYSFVNFSQLASEGHQKVLGENLEPDSKVKALSLMEWSIIDLPDAKLSLPDCVALAHYPDRGVMPLGFVGNDDLSGVIFPLSPSRAICAGTYRYPEVLKRLVEDFSTFAALCSWDFVVTPPSYPSLWVPQSRIGDAVISMMVETMEKSITESLVEASL